MGRYKVPLGMITIFHPEEFLGVDVKQLAGCSALKKNRVAQESFKEQLANTTGAETISENFHNRIIINFGKPQNIFRKTWLAGDSISSILTDYSLRLINTSNEEGQAKYKMEARPNWGDEGNILPNDFSHIMRTAISNSMISIRQVWVNPFLISNNPKVDSPYYDFGATVNLVIGPFDKEDCLRKANVRFVKDKGLHTIHQHRPYFNDNVLTNAEEMNFLPNCTLWWIAY